MPVFRTPQSLDPRSLDVLQFKASIGHHPYRDGVEPIGSRPEIAPRDPRASSQGNRVTLFPGDGLQGMAERGPATALYLHKRNESILLNHEVDLLAEKSNVTVKDSPTPLLQKDFGQRFETASATYSVQELRSLLRAGGGTHLQPTIVGTGGRSHGRGSPILGTPGWNPSKPAAAPHALSRSQSSGSAP